MIYGDSPEDGFVRGRAFAHPILRIAFTAPPGFRLRNAPEAVVGTHPSGATVRFDEARLANPSISTWRYLQGVWASKVALTRIERTQVDGMDAVAASTRVHTRSGVRDVRLVAIRAAPTRVYRFFFVTPPRQTREFSTPFRQMIASFRRLGARRPPTSARSGCASSRSRPAIPWNRSRPACRSTTFAPSGSGS